MKKIVELKNATVQVNNGLDEVKTILDDVNLTIYEHDFLTILGGNGAGKSTLFNVIAGTLMLTSGKIYILGKDVTNLPRGEKRGLLPRKIHHFTDEFKTLVARTGNGLEKHLDTPTGLLSGGQRQALSLLMATLKRPELLLLDEHTAALDPKTSVSLMNLTDEFVTGDELTALMITHHMEDALKYGNRLIVMKDGKIIKDLNQEEKAQMAIADYYQLFE
ncbi:ABC transporter ATP-binding protein [uncultured Streptococcus sp.]|uniref:ABC transporter ATP-binding protein n=1 Tax=uncultured Streptococcus sp. TaxID=83427 RepID=UPI002584697E|nr:ATP-binding cassette domain-containing protein [uncultured Streptococcus sp.]